MRIIYQAPDQPFSFTLRMGDHGNASRSEIISAKLRMARRVFSVPVLAVLGVDADGAKVLVSLRLAASEASGRWSGSCLTSRSGASRRRS